MCPPGRLSGARMSARLSGRPRYRRQGEDAMTSFFFFFLGIAVVGTALYYLKHTADNE